jgi:anti-sigma factor RsiW
MTCLTELTCAVYADGELSPEETRDAERHLAECPRCRTRVAALRDENRSLASALTELDRVVEDAAPGPAFATAPRAVTGLDRRNGRRAWLAAGLGLVGLAGLAGLAGWIDLAARSTGIGGDWVELGVEALLFVVMNAETLERALTLLALAAMASLGLAGALYLGRAPSRAVAGVALALAATVAALPSRSEAVETRSGRDVVVGAGETLDATLVAAGEHVRIEGTIDGDLIVAGAQVDVRGRVRGNLVAVGRAVEVTGTVDGSVYVGARGLALGGRVGRGLYAAARTATIESGAHVERDATLAGRSVTLRGDVGRQATILAHDAAVSGRVAQDLHFRGDRLAVERAARVEGAVRADVSQASGVTVDGGATVTGPVLTRVDARSSRWHRAPRAWFWAAISFFGAALLGWVTLRLAPGFVAGSADAVRSWGRSLGWGVAVLLGAPVVILGLAVTLVGLPLALVLLGLYLLGLYAAKIVVGLALGQALLRPRGNPRRDALLALVAGLAVITVATAVPWVGTAVWIAVACLGAGALARRLAGAAGAVRSSGA